MDELLVQIDRFVDDHQPGFVECSLVDAYGVKYIFVEKIPIVTVESLGKDSSYPRPGAIGCQVERRWSTSDGRSLVEVSTAVPWGIESTSGETRFVVHAFHLRKARAGKRLARP